MPRKFISKSRLTALFPKLIERWKMVDEGNNYQMIRNRLWDPIAVLRNEDGLEDMRVLDIGCNNGVLSAILAQRFASVVGLERKPTLYAKAAKTKIVFRKSGLQTSNLKYRNMSFKDYVNGGFFEKDGINAIFSCQVLYHLDNEEIDMFEGCLEQVKFILATANTARDHGSNRYKLYRPKRMRSFLKLQGGFDSVQAKTIHRRYPIFLGKKTS